MIAKSTPLPLRHFSARKSVHASQPRPNRLLGGVFYLASLLAIFGGLEITDRERIQAGIQLKY